MIFKIKHKNKYKLGDKKTVTKIAFLPMRINEDMIIWLEKYYIEYEVCNKNYMDSYGNWHKKQCWRATDSWVEIKKENK